jgi:hypothetical protein
VDSASKEKIFFEREIMYIYSGVDNKNNNNPPQIDSSAESSPSICRKTLDNNSEFDLTILAMLSIALFIFSMSSYNFSCRFSDAI